MGRLPICIYLVARFVCLYPGCFGLCLPVSMSFQSFSVGLDFSLLRTPVGIFCFLHGFFVVVGGGICRLVVVVGRVVHYASFVGDSATTMFSLSLSLASLVDFVMCFSVLVVSTLFTAPLALQPPRRPLETGGRSFPSGVFPMAMSSGTASRGQFSTCFIVGAGVL